MSGGQEKMFSILGHKLSGSKALQCYKEKLVEIWIEMADYLKGDKICQSMSICRFLAREAGIAGRNSLEAAIVDEIVDVIQDAIEANVGTQKNNLDR